jgi:hypothetical protein
MYTKGIKKIFTSKTLRNIEIAQTDAESSGYSAMSYNGDIYVRPIEVLHSWCKTPFTIDDFSDKED